MPLDERTAEDQRLKEWHEHKAHWKRWGPYLSNREWGTVREDYSAGGTAWEYFPHDHARSRAYRWGEDGIGGICDIQQRICFAVSMWNGRDPILKERLFGLTGNEGNHGEDVKEYYFYLDSTPTHSYMKYLYKYPQAEFPYTQLVEENRKRGKTAPEYELCDTGIFNENRYFDVFVKYAKATDDDVLIRITAANRGPETAPLWLLPTVWFRNRWSWGRHPDVPQLSAIKHFPQDGAKVSADGNIYFELSEKMYGKRWLVAEGAPTPLFTENETNFERLFGVRNRTPYVKDAFDNYVVHGKQNAVNPSHTGTKAAAMYRQDIPAGASFTIRLRLTNESPMDTGSVKNIFGSSFDNIFNARLKEADEFYAARTPQDFSADAKNVYRQAFAGLMWSKQFYHYDVRQWLDGDPAGPPPPAERLKGRNRDWAHLNNQDVLSMPDNWEFPWYAAWDLAFHTIPLAMIDPDYAKAQLILLLREWYMHPNGELPAYEWQFSDVNPPVHAWAAWRVYKIEKRIRGKGDRNFLERVFQKLLLNFTWWVNRKDPDGMNVFQGGFLGLDNIGVFDRSQPLPTGGHLGQSDGTSWMGIYCQNMLAIALELAQENPAYEDIASKFFEHFVYIADAMNNRGGMGIELWDEQDGFYYDVLHFPNGEHRYLQVRSMVGLIPAFAVLTLEPETLERLPDFRNRMQWFIDNRPEFRPNLDASMNTPKGVRRLLSLVNRERLPRLLSYALDENEFFSPHGIRGVSKVHQTAPFVMQVDGREYRVGYEPAESSTALFGGNSNWRGPVWFPLNFLLVEALQKFHHYYGDTIKVECPKGSGKVMTLWEVATELSHRLGRLFLRDADGKRPALAGMKQFADDPHWKDLLLFHEYFNGDTGAGLGAIHQTGWTALVAKLLAQNGE
jgi:mannosylglycerate hydrolase MGH1-like protein